jgi:hypothetical protein
MRSRVLMFLVIVLLLASRDANMIYNYTS